jgi:hypothetical protein
VAPATSSCRRGAPPSRWPFQATPFPPKTFRSNFYPYIMDKTHDKDLISINGQNNWIWWHPNSNETHLGTVYELKCDTFESLVKNKFRPELIKSWNLLQCSCPIGYTASFCEVSVSNNPCNDSPCSNGGTCSLQSLSNYICTCPLGWKGNF